MTPKPSGWDRQERRNPQSDRRQSDRQGKFDRRRNRCGRCRFFALETGASVGFCEQHQRPFSPDAFACPLYESV